MNTKYITSNSKIKFLVLAFLLLCLIYPTFDGIHHLLDDTFIHLRYAKNFIITGKIFYNQDQPSFGTSSLFYLFYISTVLRFFNELHWPLIIKLTSIFAQIFSMLILVNVLFEPNNVKLKIKQTMLFFLFLAFLFCVPATTRWLQDGMETSLGLLFSFLSILTITRYRTLKNQFYYNLLIAFIIALPGLLRLDLIPVVFSSLILLFLLEDNKLTSRFLMILGFATLFTLVWLLINYLLFSTIIPDSAVAKRSGKFSIDWIIYFIKSLASTSPFWLGTFLITFLLLLFDQISVKFRLLLIVGLIPIFVQILAGVLLGQFIHGARYFLPSIGFQIAIIFYVINKYNYFLGLPKINKIFNYLVFFLIIVASLHTIILWEPLSKVNGKTYLSLPKFLKEPRTTIGVADIGQIGWYTNARIVDFSGLVNGRDIAATNANYRIEKLITTMGFPDYLILKQEDLQEYKKTADEIYLSNNRDTVIYFNTNYLIMKMHNLNRTLNWFLWERKKKHN